MAKQWRIGIVGCGVAGLASAVALARRGHHVQLMERAPKLALVGAGLLLQPSGQLALRKLNLLEQVVAKAEPISGLHAWTHRHRTLVHLSYGRIDSNLTGYGVHRDDLFQVLYRNAQDAGAQFILGTTLLRSRQTPDEIYAVDDLGAEHGPFDVLIAADGALTPAFRAATGCKDPRISVRGGVVQRTVRRGARASASSDLRESAADRFTSAWGGTMQFVFALPRGGKAALRSRGLAAMKEEIVNLCPEAESLLGQIQSIDDLACAQYQLVSLRQWNHGRLICIGDAAHSTTPHLGQGVNLALLDAVAVADELHRTDDVPTALDRAARFRQAQVKWCWHLSNLLGPVFQNEGWLLAAARDRVLPWLPAIPWVGKVMVGTMAGLKTGLFSQLKLN